VVCTQDGFKSRFISVLKAKYPSLWPFLEHTKKIILNLPPKILYTPEILIEDLIDLNQAQATDSEDKLEKIFGWYIDWLKFAAGGGLGFCAALLIAIFASILKGEVVLNREQYFVISLIIICVSSPCFYYLLAS
jgi:hypothetical protein